MSAVQAGAVSSRISLLADYLFPVLSAKRRYRSSDCVAREGLYFEVNAGNLTPAVGMVIPGAMAEFREAYMSVLAEFNAGCNKNAVDVDAGLALKFKEQIHNAGISGAATQNPAAASKNCTGKCADQARWFNHGHGLDFEGPRHFDRPCRITLQHIEPHNAYIGRPHRNLSAVLESNVFCPALEQAWASGATSGEIQAALQ